MDDDDVDNLSTLWMTRCRPREPSETGFSGSRVGSCTSVM